MSFANNTVGGKPAQWVGFKPDGTLKVGGPVERKSYDILSMQGVDEDHKRTLYLARMDRSLKGIYSIMTALAVLTGIAVVATVVAFVIQVILA